MFRLSSMLGAVFALAIVSTAAAQEVRITSPTSGGRVAGPDVTVAIAVTGTTLVPGTEAKSLDDLHVHYMLDTDPGPYLSGATPLPMGNPNIVHTAALTYTFTDVAPGQHRVVVLLGYSNHTAFQPPVAPAVAFQVGGAAAAPSQLPRTGGLEDLPQLVVLFGLAGIAIGLTMRRRALRR